MEGFVERVVLRCNNGGDEEDKEEVIKREKKERLK
jgi:hypothetical protein